MAEKTLSMRDELQELLLVAAGAVPGALLRWQLGAALHDRDVLANVLGALILGLLLGLPYRPRLQLLIGIGFCGAFTTFSSWMVNSVELMHRPSLGGSRFDRAHPGAGPWRRSPRDAGR